MHGYSLTIRGKSVRSVESHLRRYLPGLDARLEQYSPRQAILAGHLMLALQREYSEAGAHSILNAIGVDKVASLSDESAVLALHTRALKGLTPRPNFAAAAVGAFDWHLEATQTTRAWGLLNGPDEIDWTGVRVGQIDTGSVVSG